MKRYIIGEKRLRKLLFAEDKLDALESAGVDNWNGYGMAQRCLFETVEELNEAAESCANDEHDYTNVDAFSTVDEILECFEEVQNDGSNDRISTIVKDNSLSVAILEKISFIDIEDPKLAILWKKHLS